MRSAGKEPDIMEIISDHEYTARSHTPAASHGVSTVPGKASKTAAIVGLHKPVATAQTNKDAVPEPKGEAYSDFCTQQDEAIFAVEDGVPKDAAVRIGEDLLSHAAISATDDEDEEPVECTVMKRGSYWPYFWAQRLLIVERRSLLYFAGPLAADGAAPRGFFPLKYNTRILLSFDRVSLYGRTDGLLVGIYNTLPSAPAATDPSAAGCSAHLPLGGSPARGLLSPALSTKSRDAHLRLTPQQHSQPLGIIRSRELKERNGGLERLDSDPALRNNNAGPFFYTSRAIVTPTLFPPLSLFLAPFRWMFPKYTASSGLTVDQPGASDTQSQHVHADLDMRTSPPPHFVSSLTTTSQVSLKCSPSLSFPSPASYSVPGLRFAASTSCSLSSNSTTLPAFTPPSCLLTTDSSHSSVHEDHLSFSTDTGTVASVCAHPGCTLPSPSVRDGQNKISVNEHPAQSRGAYREYSDTEVASSSIFFESSAAAPESPISCCDPRTDATSFSNQNLHSSGSFFSLPSTPPLPLRSYSSCSTHTTAAIPASHGPSNSCAPVTPSKNSSSVSLQNFHLSSPNSSHPPHCSACRSPVSSPSSYSSFPPSVTSSSDIWATATYSPVSKLALNVLTPSSAPSSPTPFPTHQRRLQASDNSSPASDTPSSSNSVLSASFLPCNLFASPSLGLSRTTSSEKPEALRCETRTDLEEAHQGVVMCGKRNVEPQQMRVQQTSDHLDVQPEYQRLEQGHSQLEAPRRARAQEAVTTGARTTLECGLPDPAAIVSVSEKILHATEEGNKRCDHTYGEPASCVESVSARGSHLEARAPVGACASEPPVLLICSQDAFAKEFNRAPKPKYLFECSDYEQQHRVCYAIARSVLRIRRQSRRKHEKQKRQLQMRLMRSLPKWQHERLGSPEGRPLDEASLLQHLPRQLRELHELSHTQEYKTLRAPQQQHSQHPPSLQHLQTEEKSGEHNSRVRPREDLQNLFSIHGSSAPDMRRSTGIASGWTSSPDANTTREISDVHRSSAEADRPEECRYLPRLLTALAEGDAHGEKSRNITKMCRTRGNECSTTATTTRKSAQADAAASVTLCQRPGNEENALLQLYEPRDHVLPSFDIWNSEGSKKFHLREPTGGPPSLRGTMTDTSAGGRCHNAERASVRLHKRSLHGEATNIKETSTARTVYSAVVGGSVSHTGGRRLPLERCGKPRRQDFFRHSTTPDLRLHSRCVALRLLEELECRAGATFPARSFSTPAFSTQCWGAEIGHQQPQPPQRAKPEITHKVGLFSTGPDGIPRQHGPAEAGARRTRRYSSYEKWTGRLRRELCMPARRVCSLDKTASSTVTQQRQQCHNASDTFRSKAVESVRQLRSHNSVKQSNHSAVHESADVIEIVNDLLEVSNTPDGMPCIDCVHATNEFPMSQYLQGHGREDLEREKGRHRDMGTVQSRRLGKTEHRQKSRESYFRGTKQQQLHNVLRPKLQHKAIRVQPGPLKKTSWGGSLPGGLRNRQSREGKSLLDDERISVRLVRALVALQKSVSHGYAELPQLGRRQLFSQMGSATFCKRASRRGISHTGKLTRSRSHQNLSKEILRGAAEAVFQIAHNGVLEKIERKRDSNSTGGDCSSRESCVGQTPATPLFSELYSVPHFPSPDVVHGACEVMRRRDVTGLGYSLDGQTVAFAARSLRQDQRQLDELSKQTQSIQCGVSEHVLQLHKGSGSVQIPKLDGRRLPWPLQQRVRAVDKLLLEQRDQLERLQSAVAFLLREREVQLRSESQVNAAYLQQRWEAERRRSEGGDKQRYLFDAGCSRRRAINACEEPDKHQTTCEERFIFKQRKGFTGCAQQRSWSLPGEREVAACESLCGGFMNGDVASTGLVQVAARGGPSRKRAVRVHSRHSVDCSFPLSKAEFKRNDVLSRGETAHEGGTPGEHDLHSRCFTEKKHLAGGSPRATRVSGKFFLEKDCSGTKDDSNVLAALSLEGRYLRNVVSDAKGQEKQRKKHSITPREFPIIFRISTPPVSSGESDVDETVPGTLHKESDNRRS